MLSPRIKFMFLAILLVSLGFATQPAAAAITALHVATDLPHDGTINWSTLGPANSMVNSGVVVPVAGMTGVTATFSNSTGGQLETMTECPGTNCGWMGNFLPNDMLLWMGGTYTATSGVGNGPLTIRFSTPERGIGFQIMADETGPFTVTLCGYNSSNTLLGCLPYSGTATTTEDGTALFVGMQDTVADISYVTVDGGGTRFPHDFAIDTVFISHATSYAVTVDSSISINFNRDMIGARKIIWFNSALNVEGLGNTPVTIYMTNSTIHGTVDRVAYSLPAPNATITFSPTVTTSTTTFDAATNTWITTVPSSLAGNAFLDGLEYIVPTGGLPGGISNVTWTGTFSSNAPGISVNWKWGAAVYTSFNTNYNLIGVKPVDDNHTSQYHNNDPAGTPEGFKSQVFPGATGDGGTDYTGRNGSSPSHVRICNDNDHDGH